MADKQVKQLSDQLGVSFGTSGIRGLVTGLSPTLCFALVKAFLQQVCPNATKVAVGIDLRPSSPNIAIACIAAIKDHGAEAVYSGAIPTPGLAFYALQNKMSAIMITGSHIPFDRNGIKFYRVDGEISKADEAAIMNSLVTLPKRLVAAIAQQSLPNVSLAATDAFFSRYTALFAENMLAGKRIGVYEHSSVARDLIKRLLAHFGAEVISLERTDTFVPIDTEAVSVEDQQKGLDWSKQFDLDGIISTDGDGDRPLIADENGHWLRGDIVGVLCADYLHVTHVVAPVNVNTVLESQGEKQTPPRISLRTKIGSPYVIAGMESLLQKEREQAVEIKLEHAPAARIIGYEANGGLLIGTDFEVNGQLIVALPTRDAILPALIILALSHDHSLPISQLMQGFASRYTASDRLQSVATSTSQQIMKDIKSSKNKQVELLSAVAEANEVLTILTIDETDGLRITLNTGDIIHLRSSGNSPELRCYAESDQQLKANELVKRVLSSTLFESHAV